MKKTVIAILIAVLVVAIGAGLCFAGLSAVHFDFQKLDRTEYVTNTYSLGPVEVLDIQCGTADVELVAEGETDCKVVCFENEREKFDVTADQGRLVIRPRSKGSGWSLFSFAFKRPRITVYLPAGTYALLHAEMTTGDLTADRALSFDAVEVLLGTGDMTMSGVKAGKLTAHGSTGSICLSDMTLETVDMSVSTGRIDLVNVVCSGDLMAKSTTGDIRLTNVDGANVYLSATTGDITGTIRTEKVFSAHASTGKVTVPDTAAGGRCEAETSTGDIRLSISGK